MKKQLDSLREKTLGAIVRLEDEKALADAKTRVLGRKGELTTLLRSLRDLPPEERSKIGLLANKIKVELEEKFGQKEDALAIKPRKRSLPPNLLMSPSPVGDRSRAARTF